MFFALAPIMLAGGGWKKRDGGIYYSLNLIKNMGLLYQLLLLPQFGRYGVFPCFLFPVWTVRNKFWVVRNTCSWSNLCVGRNPQNN
jgi:hypothetical protein